MCWGLSFKACFITSLKASHARGTAVPSIIPVSEADGRRETCACKGSTPFESSLGAGWIPGALFEAVIQRQ